mmetsp:Transcript_22335/g.41978  ORF Transcript_22335/g.41978 Transcript_22335/m.41978 type:complete len:220 (-) Transcript_22335:1555-2214(-)
MTLLRFSSSSFFWSTSSSTTGLWGTSCDAMVGAGGAAGPFPLGASPPISLITVTTSGANSSMWTSGLCTSSKENFPASTAICSGCTRAPSSKLLTLLSELPSLMAMSAETVPSSRPSPPSLLRFLSACEAEPLMSSLSLLQSLTRAAGSPASTKRFLLFSLLLSMNSAWDAFCVIIVSGSSIASLMRTLPLTPSATETRYSVFKLSKNMDATANSWEPW